MNRLKSLALDVEFNDVLVPDTGTPDWHRFVATMPENFELIVTNELPLSGWLENMENGGLLKLTLEQAQVFLANGLVKNHIYSWRMLGAVSEIAGRKLTQGCLPVDLKPNSAALIAYIPKESSERIGFTLVYAGGKRA